MPISLHGMDLKSFSKLYLTWTIENGASLSYPTIYKQARRALIRRFPYGTLYVFEPEIVAVMACFHSKRNPQSWQDRL